MLRIALVLVVLASGFWLARRARRAGGASGASRALVWLAAAALAHHVLIESWKPDWLAGLRPLLVFAAAAAGLAAWGAIAWLVHVHPRRRDPFFRWPLFGVAAIVALTPAPWGVSAGFVCAGILCFRWKDDFSTKALFRLGLLAVALAVLLLLQLPLPLPDFERGSALAQLALFARWHGFVAVFYAIAGVVAMFAGFVRDPTLGIRRIGRRLALSHALVVLVPLGLTLMLWAVTTVVGAGSERARIAAHALESEAESVARDVALALQAGAGGRAILGRAVAARGDSGALAWWIEGGRAAPLVGPTPPADSLLRAWFAAPDTVPRAGIVGVGRESWIGALAGDPAARAAAVLIPAQPVADRVAARFTGGRLRVLGVQTEGDVVLFRDGDGDARERRRGGRAIYTFRGDTIPAGAFAGDAARRAFIPLGQTISTGAALVAEGWRAAPFVVAIELDPREVLGEMIARARRSELDVLPLILVSFFGVLFGLVALFDVVMVVNMGRSTASAIGALRAGAGRLESGDLAHRIPVRGEDDLWDVARAFNEAAAGLERGRELEKERDRLENELELARRIQSHLLPAAAPAVAGWQIAGASESARQVGGDYYDHIDLGGGRMVLVIADVSGKGVPAALLMSAFRAALVSQELATAEPAAVAARLNGFLHKSVESGRFVTAFVGFLDLASGRMVYVNAGHNPPYLLRAGGGEETLEQGGTILGILPAFPFTSGEAAMRPGDLLALYTDGVTEGANAAGEMWGEARLVEALRRLADAPAARIVETVVGEVRAFEGATGPADDITMLVAKRDARGGSLRESGSRRPAP